MTSTSNATNPVPPPWYRRVTCVILVCPGCGTEAADDDNGPVPHYPTREEARKDLSERYGWRLIAREGEDLFVCAACGDKDDCARLGHVPACSQPARLDDGSLIGEVSYCDRCGAILEPSPRPAPSPAYPAAAPRHGDIFWDAAAFPRGQVLAAALARLMTRLDDLAVAAAWDAWPGDQTWRPAPRLAADPAADTAAAHEIINAAHTVLAWHHGNRSLPSHGIQPPGTWRDRAPRSILDPAGPRDELVPALADRRWLWHIEGMLAVAGTSDLLRQLGTDLRGYLTESCEHHWLPYQGDEDIPAHRQCLWCPEVEWTPEPGHE